MARDLTDDFKVEIEGKLVRPIIFAFLDFVDDPVYIWSGVGTVSWNGHSWLGVGNLGGISAVQETADTIAQNITLSLSGIPTEYLSDVIEAVKQNTDVQVWFGFLADDNSIVADPYQVFRGHIDVPTITEGADTSTVSITCENPLIDLQRASGRRYTPDDQRIDYSTDKGFDYVAAIQEWNGTWGKAGASGNVSPQQYMGGLFGPYKVPKP
jgi:hypothetical protein